MNKFVFTSIFTGLFSIFTKIFPPFVFSLSIPLYFSLRKKDFVLLFFNSTILLFLLTKIFSIYEFFIYAGIIVVFSVSQVYSKKDFFKDFYNAVFFTIIYLGILLFSSIFILKNNIPKLVSFKFTKLFLISFSNEIFNVENVKRVISKIYFLRDIIPSIIFIGIFIGIIISYYMRKKVEKFFNIKVISIPPFSKWKIKKDFIWIFIISGVVFFAGYYLKENFLLRIGENMVILTSFIYFVMGVGILDFQFKKVKLPIFLRISLYLLGIFAYPVPIMLGITETWYGFRRSMRSEKGERRER